MDNRTKVNSYRDQIRALSKRTSDPESFEKTKHVSGVVLPLHKEVEVCQGFFATCRYHGYTYDVIEVRFESGFVLPKNNHFQHETLVLINGVLENGIWSTEGEECKVVVLRRDGLKSYDIESNELHEHKGIESGVWVSVISPPINIVGEEDEE